ncbi:hypothetical protein SAZ10_09230 [Mesorhizobium sp. BAC0120]|uniref:hypothetical protein n=1 Tax=Mesorhizobium sp. BAC0120 TaxID=3090670 RepID=UPI00298C4E3A|nr:hypothetical protein [Mesorhizobium sp. BAC0120]MDW6021944.1 hypothetical protein [Mesorhizobium sp. BAC0120]
MPSLHPTEAGITLALALTLAIKIAFAPQATPAAVPSQWEAPVVTFLQHQGFAVGAPLPDIDPAMLPAMKAGCSLKVTQVSPTGWHRDVLASLARPGEQVAFVFDDKVFSTQPVWKTFFDENRRRLLTYAGLHPTERPLLGVIASPGCALKELPWGEIADLG